ncbi:MAG: hypothetical protein E7647_01860 [Ruminococcaceae bacterium]|nr:hypothetical protein [Oscillospiraceae bacterium]
MAGILFFALALLSAPAPFSLLFAVAVHEGGHILAARLLGFGIPTVSFQAMGMRLRFSGTARLLPALAVSLSGCIAGAAFALIPFLPPYFRLYCAGLSLLNLLPVSCLDGGGALLSVLESIMLPDRAFRIAKTASAVTVLLLCCVSCAVQLKIGANLTLLAVSVYLTVSTLAEGQ